ncbi:hypothetical protein ACIRPX_43155 [Streptomyces sp. NPDC101225]|uniref:hypothetical protein n=1 Tax=Streptomyces sp. NPDC101225 TaxID=3366135 RepID=UPI0038047D89
MPPTPRRQQKPYISPHAWAQFIDTVAPLELTGPRALEIALDSYARDLIPTAAIEDIDAGGGRKQVNMRISGAVWQRADEKRQHQGRYANMATLVSKLIGAITQGRLSITMTVTPNLADAGAATLQPEAQSGITPSPLAA